MPLAANFNPGLQKKGADVMYVSKYEPCLEELSHHCRIALDAMGELNFAMLNLRRLARGSEQYHHFHNAIFHFIYIFLSHTNSISCMLWPDTTDRTGDKGDCRHRRNPVIKLIKRRLGPAGKTCLNNRQWESSIKRLADQNRKPGIQEYFACNIIGPCLGFMHSPINQDICTYDPISRIFYCGGEFIHIDDLAATIYKLQVYLNRELDDRASPTMDYADQPILMIS